MNVTVYLFVRFLRTWYEVRVPVLEFFDLDD